MPDVNPLDPRSVSSLHELKWMGDNPCLEKIKNFNNSIMVINSIRRILGAEDSVTRSKYQMLDSIKDVFSKPGLNFNKHQIIAYKGRVTKDNLYLGIAILEKKSDYVVVHNLVAQSTERNPHVGTRLIEAAVKYSSASGTNGNVRVTTFGDAAAFYKKIGFVNGALSPGSNRQKWSYSKHKKTYLYIDYAPKKTYECCIVM